MSDPILRLEPDRVSVEPGGQVSLTLSVSNPGSVVQGYSIDVVSTMPLPWAQVNPATLSVYPQQEETAVIVFAPPSGPGAPGGTVPFGVRVWSQIEGGGSAVAEGDLQIGSVAGLQAKLTPLASTGRWSGRHTLAVSNWGNSPARIRISPEDPEQALGFLVAPDVVDVPLGGEVVSRIKVRTRRPTLRGTPRRLPFQVACEQDPPPIMTGPAPIGSTPSRPVVDGAFNQKPILTRAVVAVAGLVLLAGIGAVTWALTRPTPTEPADVATNPETPTGFRVAESVSPTEITLIWDEMDGVDGFKLYTVDPDTQAFTTSTIGDATTAVAELPPETRRCFRLAAIRGEFESPQTEDACSQTEPALTEEVPPTGVPSPSVTVTPSMEPAPPAAVDPDAPPLAFVTVLDAASPDLEASARELQAAYAAAGVAAKVLLTSDFELAPVGPAPSDSPTASPSPSPEPDLFLVYVDGESAEASRATCEAALVLITQAGLDAPNVGCGATRQVVARLTPTEPTPVT